MSRPATLRKAERDVAFFQDESARLDHEHDVISESKQAGECRDCEDWLLVGIDAYRSLVRAEKRCREAVYRNERPNEPTDAADYIRLLRLWLQISELAEKRITHHESRGYIVDHAVKIRELREAASPDYSWGLWGGAVKGEG